MGPYAATAQSNAKQGIEQFLKHISPPTSNMWIIGATKIFLKEKIMASLEAARIKKEEDIRRREEEKRRKEEEERRRREEEERRRKEEEERQRKLEEERRAREEAERKRIEEVCLISCQK